MTQPDLSEQQLAERHAWAILALARGHDERHGRRSRQAAARRGSEAAVEMLSQLNERNPRDARIANDLAAAYLVRAQRTDRPEDLVAALDVIERTVAMEQNTQTPLFNRALIHRSLGLRRSAERMWDRYLREDPKSPWAEEARRGLELPEAKIRRQEELRAALAATIHLRDGQALIQLIDSSRAATRRIIEEEISRWALATGDFETARSQLAVARQAASSLAAAGGDHLLKDAIEWIDRAPAGLRSRLIAGHFYYGEARRHLAEFDIAGASQAFESARRELEAAGSPFRLRAEIGLVICHYHRESFREALGLLEQIQTSGGDRYPTVQARSAWLRGAVYAQVPRPLQALDAYAEALERFEEVGETENVLNVHTRLADAFASMGEKTLAWRHRFRTLTDLHKLRRNSDKAFVLLETSAAALDLGWPHAAMVLQEEALHFARSEQVDVLLAEMLRHRAEVSLRLNDPAQAMQSLREALELSDGFADDKIRQAVQARVWEIEGQMLQDHDRLAAVERYSRALNQLPADAFGTYRVELLLRRARVLRAADRREAARRDLSKAITALNAEWAETLRARRERRGEELDQLWAPYFDRWQAAFTEMVHLLVDEGRGDLALKYAEMARARDLFDLVTDRGDEMDLPEWSPLSGEDVRSLLADDQILVEYAFTLEHLVIWVIRRDSSVEATIRTVSRDRAESLVDNLHRYAAGDRVVPINAVLRELHALLIEPIAQWLDAGRRLVIVPSDVLHRVPFAALRSAETGRDLVDDHPIEIAPSATIYLHTAERARGSSDIAPTRALIVGDPAFERRGIREVLERLPATWSQTRQIADLYPGAVLIQGVEATKDRFLAEISRHQVVHFAGHAVPNPRIPSHSSLILASSGDNDGILYARELLGLDLGQTRLVVLSACSTVGGHPIGSLSTAGLVRPILGAGVAAVVGTLWDIDSSTARVLIDFHRFYSESGDAATALRRAQLDQRARFPDLIETWAAFQLIGTTSAL